MVTTTDIFQEITEFRHELHRHPELAGEEVATQKLIRSKLEGLDLEVLPPFIGTDTVAILHGNRPGPNVSLRADIDALAVQEETGLPFSSETPGLMHACGHDAHTAMLLGAAKILASRREEIAGTVRFIWQPGEENKAMARQLVDAGVIRDPVPDFIAGQHVTPGLPVGSFACKPGPIMSSSTHFVAKFRGQGGHGSAPFKAHNPVLAAAAAVLEAQSAVPNRINPQRSGVLSICTIHGGELDNVIPNEATVTGSIRTLDDATDRELCTALREIMTAVAMAHRVQCTVEFPQHYSVTTNDPQAYEYAKKAVRDIGAEYRELDESFMSSEDFSCYLKECPGVFMRIGIGDSAPAHTSKFSVNDAALPYGMDFLARVALNHLANNTPSA
jgi:amidohydrolase